MTASHPRILIVLFDGLRPDLIGPATTPNLHRLQGLGVTLERQRTVYPSETRSAMTSLVTGAAPAGHGMVGNTYLDRTGTPPLVVDTGGVDEHHRADGQEFHRLFHRVGGGAGELGDDGDLLAGDGVEQARLADIAAAEQADMQAQAAGGVLDHGLMSGLPRRQTASGEMRASKAAPSIRPPVVTMSRMLRPVRAASAATSPASV